MEKGQGTIEQAREYLSDKDIREISKSEFDRLAEEYCNGNKQVSMF